MSNVVNLHLKCATGILVQIEALKAAGVDEVVLAINYQPEVLFYISV